MMEKKILLVLPNTTADLWYWKSPSGSESKTQWYPGEVTILRYDKHREPLPAEAISTWIKKTGARRAPV
jgi:hypothetical protein